MRWAQSRGIQRQDRRGHFRKRIKQPCKSSGRRQHADARGKAPAGGTWRTLELLRNAPSDVRVIDHLEYDDTPVATGNPDEGSHPVPTAGHGAIHVVTDVIGATAVLHGPAAMS